MSRAGAHFAILAAQAMLAAAGVWAANRGRWRLSEACIAGIAGLVWLAVSMP